MIWGGRIILMFKYKLSEIFQEYMPQIIYLSLFLALGLFQDCKFCKLFPEMLILV